MSIQINSPKSQFNYVSDYHFYMFKKLDLKRLKKYLLITFIVPLCFSFIQLYSGQIATANLLIKSLVSYVLVSVIFIFVYCLVNSFNRAKHWDCEITIDDRKIYFIKEKTKILKGEIKKAEKVDRRIIQVFTEQDAELKLKIVNIDLLFPDERSRDLCFDSIR